MNEQTSPRLSVALCTFNGAKFMAEQLESIYGQTRRVDEIVVCDDGSGDGTVEVVRAFAGKTSTTVRIEVNAQRLGVTRNFAKAISLCTGDLIFLSDQDDVWLPGKVATLVECFADETVGLAFSDARIVREDRTATGDRLWDSIWFDASEQRRVRGGEAMSVLLRHAIAAGSTLAFRAKYLPLIMPIPDFPHSHDIWITLMVAAVARLAPVNQELIEYRLHSSNQVGMRRYGLLDQIRMARHQIKTDAFQYAADLHEAAYERLVSNPAWPVGSETLELLREKIRHSQLRHHLPSRWLAKLSVIGGELKRGNYSKYSYGYKSMLQDLILR